MKYFISFLVMVWVLIAYAQMDFAVTTQVNRSTNAQMDSNPKKPWDTTTEKEKNTLPAHPQAQQSWSQPSLKLPKMLLKRKKRRP